MKRFYIKLLAAAMSFAVAMSSLPVYALDGEENTHMGGSSLHESEGTAANFDYTIAGAGEILDMQWRALGPATDYYRYFCKSGSVYQTFFVVKSDINNGGYVKGVNLGDSLYKRDKVSSLAPDAESDEKLLAAVNGDFFGVSAGVPLGVFVEEGRFVSSSEEHYAIGFDKEGRATVGKVDDKISMMRGEETFPIDFLNKMPSVYCVYLLTRDFGATTSHGVDSKEYLIRLDGEISFGEEVFGEITEIRDGVIGGEIPEGYCVLVVPTAYPYRESYETLAVGDTVSINASANEEFVGIWNAIGGGDILLLDGEITDTLTDEAIETARNPRTALGITENGEIILTVIDGRQSTYSSGVTATGLAQIMRSLGCVSAINLDGGGSSVMVLFDAGAAKVVSKPSDNAERAVPNALTVGENRFITADKHYITAEAPQKLMFTGSECVLGVSVQNSLGEDIGQYFDSENTVVYIEEDFGIVDFIDGEIHFVAGDVSRLGKIVIETYVGDEAVVGELCFEVTNEVDSFTAEETLLLSSLDGEAKFTVSAEKGGREVDFGDALEIESDCHGFMMSHEGEEVSVWVNPYAADEYPLGLGGTVTVRLGNKSVSLPTYFSDDPALIFDLFVEPTISVSPSNYEIYYDEGGGVKDGGAFIVDGPIFAEDGEFEPFALEINNSSLKSRGINGKTFWLWVDGLTPNSNPYALFELTDDHGRKEVHKIYYEAYYDLTDFCGRALLKLDVTLRDGIIDMKTVLGYTSNEELVHIEAGPLLLSSDYDTNLYADTVNHWSSYYVNALSYMGIISGSEDINGKLVYNPDSGLSREQFAKILVNYLMIDVEEFADVELDFADAEQISAWAIPYVRAAVGAGLMRGRSTPEDTVVFAPSDGIKRQEAIYVLGGLLEEDAEQAVLDFTDSDKVAPFAAENLAKALKAGIVSGYSDGSIRPEGGITRGEAATLVVKLYNYSTKG